MANKISLGIPTGAHADAFDSLLQIFQNYSLPIFVPPTSASLPSRASVIA